MRVLVVVIAIVACSRPSSVGSPPSPAGAPAGSARAAVLDARTEDAPPSDETTADAPLPDAPPAPVRPPPNADLGCKQDRAAREACYARGDTFIYGADPLFLCRGVPSPDEKADAAARRKKPCECFTQADYNQRQHQCMITP